MLWVLLPVYNMGVKHGQGQSNLDGWLTAAWPARLVCRCSFMFTMTPALTWHWDTECYTLDLSLSLMIRWISYSSIQTEQFWCLSYSLCGKWLCVLWNCQWFASHTDSCTPNQCQDKLQDQKYTVKGSFYVQIRQMTLTISHVGWFLTETPL